jgi:hypothetical protein
MWRSIGIIGGHRVTAGPIVYCALEGAQGFKNRIEAFRRAKMSEADNSDPPFYLLATPFSLVRDQKAFIAEIGQQLGGQKPVAICIDTLNRSFDGSESSDEDMTAYLRAADAIRDAFGCLVVIVHHCGHEGQRPRGHSSLMCALDVQIAVRLDPADNIVAELELSKDGEVGLQFLSRLKVVEIGVDQDGDPITSCVIEETESGTPSAEPKRPRLPKSAKSAPLCSVSSAARRSVASRAKGATGGLMSSRTILGANGYSCVTAQADMLRPAMVATIKLRIAAARLAEEEDYLLSFFTLKNLRFS